MKTTESVSSKSSLSARTSPLLLAVIFFLFGGALTGIWLRHTNPAAATAGLTAPTKNMLAQLSGSVTLHYYSLLPATTDQPLIDFAGRVSQLLNTIQDGSSGKVQVVSIGTPAETNATAAGAEGIQAFNLDKGDACFLGITISSGKNHETFARLQPDWEPALEYDLARAIARVAAPAAPAHTASPAAQPAPEMVASVNRLIPDVSNTTVETADQIFHAEFMKECSEAGTEAEAEMNTAQQQVVQAQASGSPADLEAAQKNLAKVQIAQGDKIKQIAARLQIRLAVFQQLKSGGGVK